jgi:hypothetical protein
MFVQRELRHRVALQAASSHYFDLTDLTRVSRGPGYGNFATRTPVV